MTLTIESDGRNLKNFISAEVKRSIRSISGGFTFTTSADDNDALPVKVGDPIKILADDTPVITGFIDTISVGYGANGHTITASGRDITQDIVDSTVGSTKEFKGSLTLESIMFRVISDLGLGGVMKVINRVATLKPFLPTEITSAEIGQTAFDFFESYARKRQVLMTTDGAGNIELVRGAITPVPIFLANLTDKSDPTGLVSNIISATASFDITNRFNKYTVRSQGNPISGLPTDTPDRIAEVKGEATDSDIRSSRRLEFKSEEPLNALEATERANWEQSIRRANSLRYSATVQGHSFSISKTLYNFNQLIVIQDDFCDIHDILLSTDVTFKYGLSGSTTTIDFTYKDAFQNIPLPPTGPKVAKKFIK